VMEIPPRMIPAYFSHSPDSLPVCPNQRPTSRFNPLLQKTSPPRTFAPRTSCLRAPLSQTCPPLVSNFAFVKEYNVGFFRVLQVARWPVRHIFFSIPVVSFFSFPRKRVVSFALVLQWKPVLRLSPQPPFPLNKECPGDRYMTC